MTIKNNLHTKLILQKYKVTKGILKMKTNKIRIALHSSMFYGIVINLNKGKAKITSKHCSFFHS